MSTESIKCLDDNKLVDYLVETQLPLTVCLFSNVALKIFDDISQHTFPEMLNRGLNVSIHSDDPAHFNAYLIENILGIAQLTSVTKKNRLYKWRKMQ